MKLDERETKLQGYRLRMNRLSVGSLMLESMIMALYAWTGTVAWNMVLGFLVMSVGTSLVFTLAITLQWNLRLKDKGMLLPQLLCALATQLLFLALVPQLSVIFLASILVFYNFAMMSFDRRQFQRAWLLFGLCTAAALYAGSGRFGYPGTTGMDIAILWLFFFLAFGRLTTIGAQFSHLRTQLSEKNRQLRVALEKNEEMARRDDLTGCHNRRFFMQMLDDERERMKRTGQAFCIAIFDLDHFKSINDHYGHLAGDTVLREFCKLVQASMRVTDRFARYGGEEFVLMLTATTDNGAVMFAMERIRAAVEKHDWEAIAVSLAVTVSAGVTVCRASDSTEDLLGRADRALYEAKRTGRNRIVCA